MHMEEAANLISSLQQTLSEVDAVVANVNERSKRTIMHIETAAQRLIQTITKHRHKLVSKVCDITEAKLHALQGEKELVQDNFRAVEDVLRCAQNAKAVEDCEEWENALSRQLKNLKAEVFDFQEHDEDMKFHFLYREENLLAAICKFGDVFTVPNDPQPRKFESQEVIELQANEDVMEESGEELETATKDVEDYGDGGPLLMETFNSQGEITVSETNFVEAVMTKVFEETADVTELKGGANESKELNKEDTTTEEQDEEEVGDLNEKNEDGDDETVQDVQNMIQKKKMSDDCFDSARALVQQSPNTEDETFSAFSTKTASTVIEDEIIKDLNNNSEVTPQEGSSVT